MLLVLEVALWWAVLVGIWMITVSPPDWPDVWVAAGAALICTVLAVAARRVLGDRWRAGRETVRWPLLVPVAAVADTFRVLTVPLREARRDPRKSDLERVQLPRGGPERRAATRRAEATVLVSVTPATMAVECAPDENALLVHRLASGRPDLTKAVAE